VNPHFNDILGDLLAIAEVPMQLQHKQPTGDVSRSPLIAQTVNPIDECPGAV
jgi:hypothetical protein